MTPAAGRAPDPPARKRLFERVFFDLGATAQAFVPGAYAWAVTVLPAAFARGAPWIARGVAVAGVAFLAAAPVIERRRPALARVVSIWGLVVTSLVVWVVSPAALLAPGRLDALRGVSGTLGWALFALVSSAPAIDGRSRDRAKQPAQALTRRGDSGRLDVLLLALGIGGAAALQLVGWRAEGADRALLVRLVALASGVMLIGASASLVGARHLPRQPDAPARRVTRAALPLVLFGLLAVAGAVYTLAAGR